MNGILRHGPLKAFEQVHDRLLSEFGEHCVRYDDIVDYGRLVGTTVIVNLDAPESGEWNAVGLKQRHGSMPIALTSEVVDGGFDIKNRPDLLEEFITAMKARGHYSLPRVGSLED